MAQAKAPAKTAVRKAASTKAKTKEARTPVAHGVGRRKSSISRVWVYRGSGKIVVNDRPAETYFSTDVARQDVAIPLQVAKFGSSFDYEVRVVGGGQSGQVDAIKLGIARALLAADESLKPALRDQGLLTVDARVKERKKYGQKGARRKFQFVKR